MDIYFELASETFTRLSEKEELKCELSEHIEMRCFDVVTREERKLLNREVGRYITLEIKENILFNTTIYKEAEKGITHNITRLLKRSSAKKNNILVVGLGNPKMTADSLGVIVAKKGKVAREGKGIRTVIPSVFGETGVESYDVVRGVVNAITPDAVVVVDTLACKSVTRLYRTFQLTDAGICPGAGLGNHRKPLSKATLGIPVISIGVPLISYTSEYPYSGDLCVTPKEIDVVVEELSAIIAKAINKSVYGKNS